MDIELKNQLEAILFLEIDPVSIKDLSKNLEVEEKKCRKELELIKEAYQKNNSALDLLILNDQVQLVVKDKLASFYR